MNGAIPDIAAIDLQGRWQEVLGIVDRPSIVQALDAGMRFWCNKRGLIWDESKGPWYYATENRRQMPPDRKHPDWYRCYGACHSLAGWCGRIGECLHPELSWKVVTAMDRNHSAAIGFRGDMPERIADILWHMGGLPPGTPTPEIALAEAALGTINALYFPLGMDTDTPPRIIGVSAYVRALEEQSG